MKTLDRNVAVVTFKNLFVILNRKTDWKNNLLSTNAGISKNAKYSMHLCKM